MLELSIAAICLVLAWILSRPRPGVWQDKRLRKWASKGGISPFVPAQVNPCSYDLTWSGRFCLQQDHAAGLPLWGDYRTADTLTIMPGQFVLMDTREYVRMPKTAMALLWLKSTMGRLGMEHAHAGVVESDFLGTLTLEIMNVTNRPLVVRKHDRLVQLVMHDLSAPSLVSYLETGRYVGQSTPQAALPERGSHARPF